MSDVDAPVDCRDYVPHTQVRGYFWLTRNRLSNGLPALWKIDNEVLWFYHLMARAMRAGMPRCELKWAIPDRVKGGQKR